MKKISLTQGKFVLVDDEDFASLNLYKWYAKESHSQWYAVRKEGVRYKFMGRTKRKTKKKDVRKNIRMHNQLMCPDRGNIVHHIDNNGLNNQRHNLKCCTVGENLAYAGNGAKPKDDIPF